jgi:hypothetical protein
MSNDTTILPIASRILIALTLVVAGAGTSAFAQDTCPEAVGDGVTDATTQIQTCLDRSNVVQLAQGNYLLTSTIFPFRFRPDGAEFSSIPGQTATLVAAVGLLGNIVHAGNGHNGYRLHDIHIDGRLDQGRSASVCSTDGTSGYNLSADGNSWFVYNIESFNSPCANMIVDGSGIWVNTVFLWHSGLSHCGPNCGGPVGDGLDVMPGSGGEISNVTILDATDIGLASGGGSRWIHNIHISNVNYRGWAGFNVGIFNGSGNHSGAIYEDIHVNSGFNLLNIGLLLGSHPWSTDPSRNIVNAGTFRNNSSTGAMINMVVEGIAAIDSMFGNTTSIHQGGEPFAAPGCSGYEYTAWHFNNPPAAIQPGWQGLEYDLGVFGNPCVPQ